MCRKSQFFFVTPQYFGSRSDGRFGHDLVQVGNLIFAVVSDEDEDGSLAGEDGSFDEGTDSFV